MKTFEPYFTRGVDEPEWVVWILVAAGLILGAFLYHQAQSQVKHADYEGGRIVYPAGWLPRSEDGAIFAAASHDGVFAPMVVVRHLAPEAAPQPDASIIDVATAWSLRRGQGLTAYRPLALRPAKLGDRDAAEVEYAFVADPPGVAVAGRMPGLLRAIDTLVPFGTGYAVLTYAAEAGRFDEAERLRLLAGWNPAADGPTSTPATAHFGF